MMAQKHIFHKLVLSGVVAIVVMGMQAQATLYPNMKTSEPTDQFPASFSAFNPPIDINMAIPADAPQIAEWTRSNEPGDTMVLTGEKLSFFSGEEEGRDTQFIIYGEGRPEVDGLIQRLDGQQCAITLSTNLPPNDMYLMWPRNENGFGMPVTVNKTEAWWVGPDQVAAGEAFSIYGRSLALGGGDSHIYIEEMDRWVESVSANPYKVDFIVPSDITTGTYTVWVHNGHGGRYGWAKPLSVEIIKKTQWDGPIYNIKDFGAIGDGVTDDFSSIELAINAADSDPYSTVYFPAGTYAIAGRLPMKNKRYIRYMGDGMDQTIITLHSDHPASGNGPYIVQNCSDYSEYRDMTFQSNEYGGDKQFFIRGQTHVYCENVRFSQLESINISVWTDVVDTHGADHIKFKNCEFITSGRTFFGGGRQIIVDGCEFYGLNDNNTLMSSWGGSEISIENCHAQSYDNSDPSDGFGWCKGRVFHANGTWGSTSRVYFGGNSTTNMCPRYDPALDWYEAGQVDQNSGEAFMCEIENVLWRDHPEAATANSVTLSGLTFGQGNSVAIVAGKGIGQIRECIDVDVGTGEVSIDEPWNVIPDQGSIVSVGSFTRRMIVFGNYFDGTERAVSDTVNNRNIANAGVQPYGGGGDWIIAGNTFHQMRDGVKIFARCKDNAKNTADYCAMPYYFNTIVDNVFSSCRNGIKVFVDKRVDSENPVNSDISVLGGIFRRNVLSNTVSQAISSSISFPEGEILMNVFDRNSVHSLGSYVLGSDGQHNQVWVNNTFQGNNIALGLTIAASDIPALRSNKWYNFKTKFGGNVPGAVLELPRRVVTLASNPPGASVAICNSGTTQMVWNASETSSWLRLAKSEGEVSDENSQDSLAFDLEPGATPSAGSQAVITVASGGQTKQITVYYSVSQSEDSLSEVSYTPFGGWLFDPNSRVRAKLLDTGTFTNRLVDPKFFRDLGELDLTKRLYISRDGFKEGHDYIIKFEVFDDDLNYFVLDKKHIMVPSR